MGNGTAVAFAVAIRDGHPIHIQVHLVAQQQDRNVIGIRQSIAVDVAGQHRNIGGNIALAAVDTGRTAGIAAIEFQADLFAVTRPFQFDLMLRKHKFARAEIEFRSVQLISLCVGGRSVLRSFAVQLLRNQVTKFGSTERVVPG